MSVSDNLCEITQISRKTLRESGPSARFLLFNETSTSGLGLTPTLFPGDATLTSPPEFLDVRDFLPGGAGSLRNFTLSLVQSGPNFLGSHRTVTGVLF